MPAIGRRIFVGVLLVVLLSASSASALQCYSCDGLCNCRNPSRQECHPNTQCYTVKRLSDGKITHKGCTSDCSLVNDFDGMCSLCRGYACNTETSLTPMNGPYDECSNQDQQLGQGVGGLGGGSLGQGVGGGLGQQQPGVGGLGQGVGGGGLGQQQPGIGGGLGQGVGGGLGQSIQGVNQPDIAPALGDGGLGQGVGNPGIGQSYQQQQHIGPGPLNGGPKHNLNYQPAPSVGASSLGQNFDQPGQLGQGFGNNDGMGQGFNNNGGLGQGFRNSAQRFGYNLAMLGAAAVFGLNRL